MAKEKLEEKYDPGEVDDYETAKTLIDRPPVGWGFDMYPDRRSKKPLTFKTWFFNDQGRESLQRYKCEKTIIEVMKKSPVVRIMISALEHAGCPINYRRHFNCENCEPQVTGGYDSVLNQIVLCYHAAHKYGYAEVILFHELIHMFDYCTGNLDFTNLEHLACTEIRAANLTYCGLLAGFWGKFYKRGYLRKQHQVCVKNRAVESLLTARPVTYEEAKAAVLKVFDKCYNDLEPIGRRLKGFPVEGNLAYAESFLLGYE